MILSGEDDLRTPTANAREVAAQIPESQLLIVPDTGHSVLTAESGSCAKQALEAMFAGQPVERCGATPQPSALRPPPLPPVRLALVSPARGYQGRSGRTLHAITLTLGDFARQLLLQLGSIGSSSESLLVVPTLRSGGLRAGWAELGKGGLTFHGYSYVPGVTVSGTIGAEAAELEIGGPAAAHGKLRLGAHDALVGTLGGRQVSVGSNSSGPAAIVGVDALARSNVAAGRPAASAAARELARLLGRFLER